MISHSFFLKNGLLVVLKSEPFSQISVVNILYRVGSKNDPQNKTGLAHLFEHLMFCGTKNVKSYDKELQKVGGSNNAYTNFDITNYYCIVPTVNLETALLLESDRMANLDVSKESLEIQKNVVTEELKESYYNTPYGDAFLHLMPLIFPKYHYYSHPIIGDKEHIKSISLEDINTFKKRYYTPDNAILVISGNINFTETEKLIRKYFENIDINSPEEQCDCSCCPNIFGCEHSNIYKDTTHKKDKIIKKNIPLETIYYAFNAPNRIDKEFYATNVLCEILNCGDSSILHKNLVENKRIFNSINVEYIDNIFDGIIIINGFINENINIDIAKKELNKEIEEFKNNVNERELLKAKNNIKSDFAQDIIDIETSTDLLANFTNVKDSFENFIARTNKVELSDIVKLIQEIFNDENKSSLIYVKNRK